MRRIRLGLDFFLVVLLVLSMALLFLANEDPFVRNGLCSYIGVPCYRPPHGQAYDKILYDIGVGVIVSVILYWLLVRLPDYQRRQRIKKSFSNHYNNFREDCIRIFLLVTDGSYDAEHPRELSDQAKFREYFKEDVGQGQDRWDAFFNKVDDNYLQELIIFMEIFRDEIAFVLNNTDIANQDVFEFFKRLSRAIYANKRADMSYGEKESFTRFLWEVFAGWSFVSGYRSRDIVKEMIERI